MTSLDLTYQWILVTVLGWLLGSLGGAMAYRIPRDLPLGLFKKTRSCCPQCNHQIPFWQNIPLISFILLGGKCAFCGKSISRHYFWVELSTLGLFLLTFSFFLISPHTRELAPQTYWAELARLLYFSWSFVVLTAIDLEFRIIPDRFSLGNWVIALACAVIWGLPDWTESLAGGAVGFGIFFALSLFYEKVRKIEGLGMGDVKMMGWIGSWLGFMSVPLVILVASVTGLLAGLFLILTKRGEGMKTALPFGPFIALGAYVAWVMQTLQITLF